MRKMRDFSEYLFKRLADRERLTGYLQAALEDYQIYGEPAVFLLSLRTAVESQGGISALAKQTDTPPETFSKVLSANDAPRIDTLGTILKALGCRLTIEPPDAARAEESEKQVSLESALHVDVAD